MDLEAVRQEIKTRLDGYGGLRAYAYAKGQVAAPAALVGLPESVDYGRTYQRGLTTCRLPVVILVGEASSRTAGTALLAYVSEAGSKSVPARILSNTGSWASCDDVTPVSATFPDVSVAGVEYLAVEINLEITGRGV